MEDTQALVVVPVQNQTSTNDVEVEDLANGEFKVQFEGMGVPMANITT